MKLNLNKAEDNAYLVRILFDERDTGDFMLLLAKNKEDAEELMHLIVDKYDDYYEEPFKEHEEGVLGHLMEFLEKSPIEFIFCQVYDALLS
jgi:hypothetical protein